MEDPSARAEQPFDQVSYEASEVQSQGRSAWIVGGIQLVFVIGVIAAALTFSSALKSEENAKRPQLADMRDTTQLSLRVLQPERMAYAPQIKVNGTVQASAEVAVSPQVSGEIKRVSASFRVGSEVKRGDLLFEIDRADFELAVERAEAEIAAAQSDLTQLKAEAQLAIEEWVELFPDREINPLAAREPQIEAAEARLTSAIANKRTAELSLQRTRVYAPVNARVISSTLDIGQIVSPGQALGRLVSLDSIELVVPVSQEQQAVLEPVIGRKASFQPQGLSANRSSATVARVDASLDARTRLSNLFLRPESQDGLRIGNFVDVILEADVISNAMVLPSSALTGQDTVWIVEEGRLMARQIVRLGETNAGAELIVAPFDIGDGVVIVPPLEAEEGQEVSIRAEPLETVMSGGRSRGSE